MKFRVGQKVKIIGYPWIGVCGKIVEIKPLYSYPYRVSFKNRPIGCYDESCPYSEEELELELVIKIGEQLEFAFMEKEI